RRTGLRGVVLALVLLLLHGGSGSVLADEAHPLKPIPTGSPRETLQGFLEVTDALYRLRTANLVRYAESSRLAVDADERAAEAAVAELLTALSGRSTCRRSPRRCSPRSAPRARFSCGRFSTASTFPPSPRFRIAPGWRDSG
ncbi:hypothetical protein, partial [Rhodoblastus sp.]|uniref:hypothetical protein n=1 Tax=Rhodoblastus sp. TaxID=1962975 RepID=UPI003F954A0A